MYESLGERFILRGRKRKILEYILICAVSFLLCGVGFYGEIAPLGVCFQGCFAGKRRMFFSFLGVVIGSCIWGYSPVKYIAVSLIVVIVNEAFMHLTDIGSYSYAVCGVTGAMGVIGLVSLISPENDMAGLLYVAELVICILLSVLMFGVAGGKSVAEKQGGRLISAVLICSFCASVIPSIKVNETVISFSHAVVSALSVYAALKAGVFGGVIVGLVSGITLDLSGSGVPVWCFSLALGGIAAGFSLGKKVVIRVLLFFLLASCARLITFGNSAFWVGTFELFLGSLSVLFVPQRFLAYVNAAAEEDADDFCIKYSQKYISEQILGISDAYGAMAQVYSDGTEKVYIGKKGLNIYEGACRSVCASCESKADCWEERSEVTKHALEKALTAISARGNADVDDFGEEFSCIKPDEFCDAVTEGLRKERLEMLDRGEKLAEDARLRRQYNTISEILESSAESFVNDIVYDRESGRAVKKLISGYGVDVNAVVYRDARRIMHVEISGQGLDILMEHTDILTKRVNNVLGCCFELPVQTEGKDCSCITFKECSKNDFSVGASAEKRSGENISGDAATYFRDKEGNMFVVLCDGMGSGETAHKRAEEIMRLCESFLRIGVSPISAAELVTATLEHQDRGAGGVTLDIARIDPYTSILTSVKYGAAPTYIRHRTADGRYSLSKICAGGPGGELYGIADAEVELSEGDTILMASDGAENGNYLEKSLVGVMTDDPSDLCDILMHMLPREASDDRTLIAVNYFAANEKFSKKERYSRV